MDFNKKLYPEFEFKLWSKDNITKENFPYNHDILWTLYNMEKTSRFSKKAVMADFMRQEIIYHLGGFYMDSSMLLFKRSLLDFLSYKFVIPTERNFRHRWAQNMCMFGAMPKFAPLFKMISPRYNNRKNIWL